MLLLASRKNQTINLTMMEFKSATSRPHIRNRDSDNMDDSSTRQEKLADYSKSRASFTSTDFAVAMDLDGSSQHSEHSKVNASDNESFLASSSRG